jgi:hypothetical protein
MTITLITLLKRKTGMSKADFMSYYEAHHRRIGERVIAGYGTRYERRYLTPRDGTDQPHDFDVVTEIDFPDQATLDAWSGTLAYPEILSMIVADEEQLFDRSKTRTYTVDARASDLPLGDL